MNYGYYQRTKPRLVVRKGWDPLESKRGIRSLPVKTGVTVYSGQVLCPELVSSEWVWALADRAIAGHRDQIPHFALSDSFDNDVVSAGKLNAVAATSQTELQTGYFSTDGTSPLNSGVPLTLGTGGNVGSLITTERGTGPTYPVVGFLTQDHVAGPVSLVGEDSSATDLNVIRFDAHYDPRNAAS